MALPTLSSRPEKTIDSSLSRWNAAALPIQYVVANTKWPTNTEDDIDTISSVSDDNGFAKILLAHTYEIYKVKEFVNIIGTTNYDGPQLIRVVDGFNITIDAPFVVTETGTLQRYFQNYTTLVRVYAGLPPTHDFAYFKELELIGTIEQRPNTDSSSFVDIRKYILSQLSTFNDIDQSSFPNDLNLWTGFYIEWAERYDQVLSGVVFNFTSEFQTDLANICFGSHSALQFGNVNGGNMSLYLLGGSTYKETLTKFMTDFDRPKLFLNNYFDITIINAGGNFLIIKEFDINSVEINEQTILVANNDEGVYRIRLDALTFDTDTKFITAQVFIPDFLPENLLSTAVDDDQIDLSWTNEIDDRDIEIFRDDVLIDTVPQGTTSYESIGLAAGTEFCYTVKYEGALSSSNESCATTFNSFILSVKTDNTGPSDNDQFTLPLVATGTYNFTVQWGDGDSDTITVWNQAETTHTYAAAGTFEIKIRGAISSWSFNNAGDRQKITIVSQWGGLDLGNSIGHFYGCSNLTITATDSPDLSAVTTFENTFRSCAALATITTVGSWDTSTITNFATTFQDAVLFNDGNINSWDMSLATTIASMFDGCTVFNQALNSWTLTNLTNASLAFLDCVAFNSNITSWDMSGVTNMSRMFQGCTVFNQALDSWTVSAATNMQQMFFACSAFNKTLNSWTVTSVTNMAQMFQGATVFNGNVTSWGVGSVASMNFMFTSTAFNQDIGSWDVSGVTNGFVQMFLGTPFNQDISTWDVSNASLFQDMFNTSSFNQNIGAWTTTAATNMSGMFRGSPFNQDISGWDLNGVTTISTMFLDNTAFNQDISAWDTSTISLMVSTFSGATAFDQDIGSWVVTALTNATTLFNNVTLTTANYDALLVGWEGQAVNNNVTFDGGNSNYNDPSAAATARAALIADHTWTITDGGGV